MSKITTNTKDYIYPPLSSDRILPKNISSDSHISLETSARAILHSPHVTQSLGTANHAEERATTVLSSGYGTLSAMDTALEPAQSPGEDDCGRRQKEKHHSLTNDGNDAESPVTGGRRHSNREEFLKVKTANQFVHQQRAAGYACSVWKGDRIIWILFLFQSLYSFKMFWIIWENVFYVSLFSVGSSSNVLTSWAQRQKLRTKKSKSGQNSSQSPEYLEKHCSFKESHKHPSPQNTDPQEQVLLTLLELLPCSTAQWKLAYMATLACQWSIYSVNAVDIIMNNTDLT